MGCPKYDAMRRVVLDTNILTAALRSSEGASFGVLRLVAERQLRPLVTTALFLAYEAVLRRREHMEVHGLSTIEIERFLAEFAALSEPVDVHFVWRPQLSDVKDEFVLEAAVNGRADALLTYNTKDFGRAAQKFGLRVMSPGKLLVEMRS
jgi:putative PIN family toxin of toxin-antitoxin system